MVLAQEAQPSSTLTARERSARGSKKTQLLLPGQVPRLSIVIVNYRQWNETAALARQILTTPAAREGLVEVVVVDNHSPVHPLTHRLRRWPGLSLRRWQRNRGFARAVNEGCRLAQGQWILLLNPDVSLEAAFIECALNLLERLPDQDPRMGVLGFHLRNADGSRQLSSGWFPTLASTLGKMVLPRARRKYCSPPTDKPSRVSWVTGCCFLLRRDCLDQVGGFDEDYFLYYEDVDFCRRARDLGWTVWYEPALRAVHHRPLHSREVAVPLRVFTRHALLTYGGKHWQRWQFLFLAGIIQAESWLRELLHRCRGHSAEARHFQLLRAIARDLVQGSPGSARRRLDRVVRHEERQRAT